MFNIFKGRNRERLRAIPFPTDWDAILEKNVPMYARLDQADRKELQGHIQVFLAEKHFEGCGGGADRRSSSRSPLGLACCSSTWTDY